MKRLLLVFAFLLIAHRAWSADRPNFVWLISEDNSIHYMKLFDQHGAETPRIAQLARHGLVFPHAFSCSPVCSVARTTLITGCYGPRICTQFHRRSAMAPMPDNLRMFPAYLRQAGYYTTNNSKKDYNAIEGKGVWDDSSNKAIWRNRKPGQPFFHKQSFGVTHESSLHFPKSVMDEQATQTDPDAVFVAPYHPKTRTFRYTYARYHDRIEQLDAQIGTIVDRLAEDGLLEDTFIFYFGDHGGVLPRGKGYAYESGLHVPLVVRVPENWKHLVQWKPGSDVQGFVSFIDFGPTVLNLASLKVPSQVDGRPFLGPGYTASDIEARDEAFGYADRFDEKYDLVRTLRKGRHSYVRSYQPFNFDGLQNNYRYKMLAYTEWRELHRDGKLTGAEKQFFEARSAEALYDIWEDPHETKNLANDPEYADLVKDFRMRMANQVKEMPDLSFYPESYLVESAMENPVEFGQRHKEEIAALVDIADLSLLEFDQARESIARALSSTDPWRRYWGAIVCSSFGNEAESFVGQAMELSNEDPNLLVRTRAAEFLGLTKAADPRPALMTALAKSNSDVEANLILNTVVLLRDGEPNYDFKITSDSLNPQVRNGSYVRRRLEYLDPIGTSSRPAEKKARRGRKRSK